jgi:hypothetical protein
MRDDRSQRLSADPGAGDWLAEEQPDLAPLRALADREELADAVCCLASQHGLPLRADDPLAPLARELATALTVAGFTLHHCARSHPLYRLGGVCVLPATGGSGPASSAGVVVSWTTHNLLSLDWDRWGECQGAGRVMNEALAEVLEVLGFEVQPFGQGGASLVTGRRASNRGGAGR